MIDPTDLVNVQFLEGFFAIASSILTHYTKDIHGKPRPFVIYLSLIFGLVVTGLIGYFGYETVFQLLFRFVFTAVTILSYASAFWLFILRSKSPSKLKSDTASFIRKVIGKSKE